MSDEEYDRIVKEYADVVYRVAISYTKSYHDACDVVQSTFVKLLTKKVEFEDEEHIRRWLIKVAVNECRSLWSSFWRKNVSFFEEIEEEPEFTSEDRNELYEAIKALPQRLSIVVHLFYYEGYSSKEIAKLLYVNEATVRTRLTRARKILKQQLKEAWEDEE